MGLVASQLGPLNDSLPDLLYHGFMPALDSPVQFLKGVGPRRAEMLAKVGVNTVGDLLGYRPLRYEDRSNFQLIKDIQAGRG